MRRFLIVLAVVAFCTAPTWADSIDLDVVAWATYTATQPCSSNCTETIGISFLYYGPTLGSLGGIVPGTLNVSSSGFLGMFSGNSWVGGYYAPLFNGLGDEIDLVGTCGSCSDGDDLQIAPGIDTLSFWIYSCKSQACDNAYGPDATNLSPTSQSSVATRVAVPDGDSFPLLMLTTLCAVGLVWPPRGRMTFRRILTTFRWWS